MTETDLAFFEEYKAVDKLCREMLRENEGVSAYLRQMEATDRRQSILVPGWEEDYKLLKRFRYLRNQIAHDSSSSFGVVLPEDLTRLNQFHTRLWNQDDPFGRLRRAEQSRREQEQKRRADDKERAAREEEGRRRAEASRRAMIAEQIGRHAAALLAAKTAGDAELVLPVSAVRAVDSDSLIYADADGRICRMDLKSCADAYDRAFPGRHREGDVLRCVGERKFLFPLKQDETPFILLYGEVPVRFVMPLRASVWTRLFGSWLNLWQKEYRQLDTVIRELRRAGYVTLDLT